MTTVDSNQFGRFETLNRWQRKGLAEFDVSPSARHVWHVLWGRANKLGVVRMSYKQIAAETGLSKRSCMRCVKELIGKEIIKIHRRGDSNNMANLYAIQVEERKPR